MMKTYEEELILRTCHCDFQGQWRPSAILESMQEAAGAHSHLLGLGRAALLEEHRRLRELYPESEDLFDIVLVTNNHAQVGVRLINSINHYGEQTALAMT